MKKTTEEHYAKLCKLYINSIIWRVMAVTLSLMSFAVRESTANVDQRGLQGALPLTCNVARVYDTTSSEII
jgi:hypothetical protein